jgi:Zinc-binding dehydrogenase
VGNIIKAVALNPLAGQTLKSFTAKVTAQALKEVSSLIETGSITPVIDRTYPLTEASAAVALVEEGSPAGKVIVVVQPPPPKPPPADPTGPSRALGRGGATTCCRGLSGRGPAPPARNRCDP